MEKYRPANGTEGEMFMEDFCYQCTRDDLEKDLLCPIIARTMALDVDDEGYPDEWQYIDGQPVCTAFDMRKGGQE